MIHRAVIHVAGPPKAGKTTLIERLLEREAVLAICVRGEKVPRLRREKESAPKGDPELRRYRDLGATVACYRFPHEDPEAFYDSEVMGDYSEVVLIEGDCPLAWVDLSVFVAPAPQPGESLLRRGTRDRAAGNRATADRYAAALETPEKLTSLLAEQLGEPMASLVLGRYGAGRAGISRDETMDEIRKAVQHSVERARKAPPPAATKHWALEKRYEGLERAQLVVINLHPENDRARAEDLCGEIPRLRKDRVIFEDVVGLSGNRVPITAVVANLEDPRDAGLRKCLNRVKRSMARVSG